MDDLRIIELYFERDEQAIKETDAKYGNCCLHKYRTMRDKRSKGG